MFLEFLNRIFDGNNELIGYIQKALGYCLTGDIREHAMFFGYGTGANGKSVLLSAVAGIMVVTAKPRIKTLSQRLAELSIRQM
jgi:putative DNA primase/helicase